MISMTLFRMSGHDAAPRPCARSTRLPMARASITFARSGVLAAVLAMLAACGGGGGDPNCGGIACQKTPTGPGAQTEALTGVSVTPAAPSLAVGQSVQLNPTPNGLGTGASVIYSYSSGTPSIASVSATGVVSGVAAGTATITVTATASGTGYATATRTTTATVSVSALPPALAGLTATLTPATLAVGQTVQVTPSPTGIAPGVSIAYAYATNAPAVATVSSTGVVTAVGAGTATISVTATATGGGYVTSTITATTSVTVNPATCAATNAIIDVLYAGSLASSDCGNGIHVADAYRLTLAAPRVVELVAKGAFTPIGVSARLDPNFGGGTRSIGIPRADSVSGFFLLPAGTSYALAYAPVAQSGPYSLLIAGRAEDVDGCRAVVVIASVTTQQTITSNSCLDNNLYNDRFFLYAPGRSCTIEMRRIGAGAGTVADPYLRVYSSTGTLLDYNDDLDGSTLDARVTFNDCVDGNGGYLEVRASGLSLGQYGTYTLVFSIAGT